MAAVGMVKAPEVMPGILTFERGPYCVSVDVVEMDGRFQALRVAAVATGECAPAKVSVNGMSFPIRDLYTWRSTHSFSIPLVLESVELLICAPGPPVTWKSYTLWSAREARPTAWERLLAT